jgi:hypothetical protein
MNRCEETGARELLSMLNDTELMSVKDTVTKSMITTNAVRHTLDKQQNVHVSISQRRVSYAFF